MKIFFILCFSVWTLFALAYFVALVAWRLG